MNAIILSSLLLAAGADDAPKPKLPVGKETTFVTGPVDKNGYVDFEAALNERLGKGVTPENNANVLLWKALGPTPAGGGRQPADYFKRLGIKEPPKGGDYFIGLRHYATDTLGLDEEQVEAISEMQGQATRRPWAAKDCPPMAEWLKANERPLALVLEGAKRPQYFNPLVTERKGDEPGWLTGALLPSVAGSRSLADALAARAMLRLHKGKLDAAWEDLLACHRLGRLVARGGALLEALAGYAICEAASKATLAYLERADLTSAQVLARLKELRSLPPLAPPADKIDLGGRLTCLDSLQHVLFGVGVLGPGEKLTPEQSRALEALDRESIFRDANKQYDRIVSAMRTRDRTSREKEFDKIEGDLKARRESVPDANALLQKLERGELDKVGAEVGRQVGIILVGELMPAFRAVQHRFDRAEQVERNLQVAFALAAYRKDNGSYPAKLAGLAPKYLPSVPDDLFSGRPLAYKPTETGYHFYSVGINGKDESGRGKDDEPDGDDIPVRMPLPEWKKK